MWRACSHDSCERAITIRDRPAKYETLKLESFNIQRAGIFGIEIEMIQLVLCHTLKRGVGFQLVKRKAKALHRLEARSHQDDIPVYLSYKALGLRTRRRLGWIKIDRGW